MAAQEPQYRNGKRTVLIADDDRTLAKVISVMLGQSGLQTVVAHDGEQALAMARAMLPDLILLDMNIPVKSGPEVYATLKADAATAAIPVVFLSGEPEEANHGPAAGAAAYLTKPFSPTDLVELVQRTIASQPVDPPPGEPDPSHMSVDQLVVYAQELRELFEREQDGRQSLQQERQRLEELDRLRMSFLGTVTHELLIPFPALGKALQVLQRQSHSLGTDQRVALDNLMTEIAGLHRMVSGVDKFVKLVNRHREPQPQDVSLSQVIPWAVQPAAVLAQARDVDFRLFVPSHLMQVHADPALLGEAIFQMAHNAVKFNLPGGRAHIRAVESDEWIVIEVTDTGVGLTPERLELLDQPFEQLADAQCRERQGLGVGWAFVRYVAEAHGGSTRVSSPGPGEGSTFALAVPAALQVQGIGVASQVPVEA